MAINAQNSAPGSARSGSSDQIQVMVVDDSAVVRGLIVRMLEADPAIHVAASVGNGQLAVNNLGRHPVDVVILDIEMPVMDGLTALPKLLEVDPSLKVIMASTLTLRNAEISIRALEAGAADYVPKPSSARDISGEGDFRRELVEKVKTLGAARQRQPQRPGVARPAAPSRPAAPAAPAKPAAPQAPISLRSPGTNKPDILAIGSSTGGPQALFALLKDIKGGMKLPIVITQHMPPTFTTILAEHINRMTGWTCKEAADGDVISPDQIYLAPGDYHMQIEAKGTQRVIRLNQNPPENFCRPAVDPMFRSLAQTYSGRILAVILTGMGSDGAKGGKAIIDAGGTVIAQDEASSVVWGMPGAAAAAGICSAVLPLKELGSYITRFTSRGV